MPRKITLERDLPFPSTTCDWWSLAANYSEHCFMALDIRHKGKNVKYVPVIFSFGNQCILGTALALDWLHGQVETGTGCTATWTAEWNRTGHTRMGRVNVGPEPVPGCSQVRPIPNGCSLPHPTFFVPTRRGSCPHYQHDLGTSQLHLRKLPTILIWLNAASSLAIPNIHTPGKWPLLTAQCAEVRLIPKRRERSWIDGFR